MKHVNAIKKDIAEGRTEEAYHALDNLLHIGPNNLEALKLQALLYHAEGRFRDEQKVWNKIIDIDHEDEDAINFYQNQQLEDRELFYFTEDLPAGGRRYLAYPRAVMTTTIFAFMGTMSFWIIQAKTADMSPERQLTVVSLAFFFTVFLPMAIWFYHFIKALKHIDLNEHGMTIRSQIRSIIIPWDDIEHACLRYGKNPSEPDLHLSILPKNEDAPHILINLNAQSSCIRARTYLLTELERYIEGFSNVCESDLPKTERRVIRF